MTPSNTPDIEHVGAVAGFVLVHKHVLAVVDGEWVEDGAQGQDAFAAHLARADLVVQLELGLPHRSTRKRPRLELEGGLEDGSVLWLTVCWVGKA